MLLRVLAIVHPRLAYRIELRRLTAAGRTRWGRHSYGHPRILTFEGDRTVLVVGAFVSIAKDVTFLLGGNHPTDRVTTFPFRLRWSLTSLPHDGFPHSKGDIVVGNDVWIAHGCVVTSGVTIGSGSVVAANSTVVSDVPPYSVVAGNPARVVRKRFDDATVERLLALSWWDWPDAEIRRHVPALSSPDAAALLDLHPAGQG